MINPFKKRYSKKEIELFQYLSKIKVFELLNYRELSYFIPFLNRREYRKNEVIFFRDDPSQALYLIREGEVKLSLQLQDTFETLSFLKPGMALGETALLPHKKRVLNATVTSDNAIMFVIPQVNIFEIFNHHVSIKAKMLQSLSDQYSTYSSNLFQAYKESLGFFQLGNVYLLHTKNDQPNT